MGTSVIVTTGVHLISRCCSAPCSAQAGAHRGCCGLSVSRADGRAWVHYLEARRPTPGLGVSFGLLISCSEASALAWPPRPGPGPHTGSPPGTRQPARPEGEGLRQAIESGPRPLPLCAGPPQARPCVPVSALRGPGAHPRSLCCWALTSADPGKGGKWHSACRVFLWGPLPCPVLGAVASPYLSPAFS